MGGKFWISIGVLIWSMFLISSFAALSYGDVDKDLTITMKQRMHHKKAIIETFKEQNMSTSSYLATSMERKFWISIGVLIWSMFLISSFAALSYGEVDKDLAKTMKQHMHHKKAIIETFKIDGHVIDCIDVNKQPAFEHPLLINHTLQMKPTYYPKRVSINSYQNEASHPWVLSKSCPKGSIPIERTQRSGHFEDSPSSHQYILNDHPYFLQQRGKLRQKDDHYMHREVDSKDYPYPPNHKRSVIQVDGGKFYGAKASINVWHPKVQDNNGSTLSQIWVTSGDGQISLEAGWTVNPGLYGDNKTRFVTSWTKDGYEKTGCHNLDCPGFVQTNYATSLSTLLQPVSVYGGRQYSISVEIFKDKSNGNWWLYLQDQELGYWPQQLVPSLSSGVDFVYFGGEVIDPRAGIQTSTQMGSGHFSSEGFTKSSFFRNVQIFDTAYRYRDPANVAVILNSPSCYDLQVGKKVETDWGYFFFYGGACKI